ncbi:MAG: hypothetical protein PHV43_02840 [Candidatus Colwellbacteria bacterium]|nr:hypothetical protein [Candidatus Colwellbacteria bacterium]
MITRDEWKKFLEVLEEMPNVSIAAKRTGIGRNTYYARRRKSWAFAEMADRALELGREAGNDLAESVVFSQMRKGNLRAAEFQLKHNCPRYKKPVQIRIGDAGRNTKFTGGVPMVIVDPDKEGDEENPTASVGR